MASAGLVGFNAILFTLQLYIYMYVHSTLRTVRTEYVLLIPRAAFSFFFFFFHSISLPSPCFIGFTRHFYFFLLPASSSANFRFRGVWVTTGFPAFKAFK